MAQLLGNVSVGNVVYLNENGKAQPYIVVNQGKPSPLYDASCNGTWLLRKYVTERITYPREGNGYESSYWNTEYYPNVMLETYDTNIQESILNVKIPYVYPNGQGTVRSGANGLSTKLFSLSAYELGFLSTDASSANLDGLYVDGRVLSYFTSGSSGNTNRIGYTSEYNIKGNIYLTRSPERGSTITWASVNTTGGLTSTTTTNYYPTGQTTSNQIRPALILPSNLLVDNSNNINTIPIVSSLTVPSLGMLGQAIPISWSAVSISGFTIRYQLQRNVNNTGWTTISSSLSNTSYNDTPQSNWYQVQYRVAVNIQNNIGEYKTSDIVPVVDSQALVISGSNSDLGTITSDVPYTVSSNTGNTITLERSVNGTQITSVSVESGFAYNIPIFDLPSGSNTIQIKASVLNPSTFQTITATRTWTYYKAPITIPNTGGVGQLVQNSQNIWPITLADCVKVPTFFGGTLDKALELIAPAVNPAVIAVGTYTGNGQFGQSHPNTLTFSKQPLIVIIYGPNITLSISSTDTSSTAYISGTTATWYSTESAEAQLNSSGVEYSYVAIATTNN